MNERPEKAKGGGHHQPKHTASRQGRRRLPWVNLTLAVFLLLGGTASAQYVIGPLCVTDGAWSQCYDNPMPKLASTDACDVRELLEASRAWAYQSARSPRDVQRLRAWEVLAMSESRWRRAVEACSP